jgi:exodeoxyribonuclease VII large subunit
LRVCLESRHAKLDRYAAEIPKPKQQIEHAKRQLTREVRALKIVGKSIIAERQKSLQQFTALLESFSYQRVLKRGFVLVTNKNKKPIESIKKLSQGMPISLHFQDGKADATVTGDDTKNKNKNLKNINGGNGAQGTLL